MSFLWDLVQQSQLSEQKNSTRDLSTRVEQLESEVRRMQILQNRLIERLEEHFQEDIDGDGKVGSR